MHPTALLNCKRFFDAYGPGLAATSVPTVVDIGAQDINGSLREVTPAHFRYVGIDFAAGKGVDVVIQNPYELPLPSESVDVVVSSSCFEHSEMFWLVFLEILRVLKPRGLFYLNVPSNGFFHRHPVDCWRFYPDSGSALVTWARRNGCRPELLESYTDVQYKGRWNDFVAVFVKDTAHVPDFPDRIVDSYRLARNVVRHGTDDVGNYHFLSEDQERQTFFHRLRRLAKRVLPA